MTIEQLIRLAENRVSHLILLKSEAERTGDVDRMASIQDEIDTTESTLSRLRTLS
jgi:hypothetical protein